MGLMIQKEIDKRNDLKDFGSSEVELYGVYFEVYYKVDKDFDLQSLYIFHNSNYDLSDYLSAETISIIEDSIYDSIRI